MWYPGQQHDQCDDVPRHFGVKNTFIHFEIPDDGIDDDSSLRAGSLKRQHSEPPRSSPHKQHFNSQPIWRSPKVSSPASSACEENTNENGSDLDSGDAWETDSERDFCQQETEGYWPMYHPCRFNGQFNEVDLLGRPPTPPPPPPLLADNLVDLSFPPGSLGTSNAMQFMVVPNPAAGMPMDSLETYRKNNTPKGTSVFDGTRLDRPRNNVPPQRGHAQVATKHLTPKFCGDCGGGTEPHYKFCLFCGTSFMVHQWE